jgi:hypothetical protein
LHHLIFTLHLNFSGSPEDRVLQGLLSLLLAIVKKYPPLKANSSIAGNLSLLFWYFSEFTDKLGNLFVQCLFGIPKIDENMKLGLPKCKVRKTRKMCFALLLEVLNGYLISTMRFRLTL